ncbi:MAG: glycosyltransferase [Chloroflexi bacterium]|nr:glycosyltransferase [Chloroflexota bacterium]
MIKKDPLNITVAIPTWNRAALLEQALQQMAGLVIPTTASVEFLVIDNNCTDNTAAVVAMYASRLPLKCIAETQCGSSEARNLALSTAAGDYVLFTDDDALVDPNWVSAFCECARRHPTAAAIGGPIEPWFVQEPDPILAAAFPAVQSGFGGLDHGPIEKDLPRGKFLFGANLGLNRAALGPLIFDTKLGLKGAALGYGEETDLIQRIRDNGGKVVWCPQMRVRHYVNPARFSLQYLKRFYEARGESWVKGSGIPPGPRLMGAPRWMWRRIVAEYAKYVYRRATLSRISSLSHVGEVWKLRGAIRQCRRANRPDALSHGLKAPNR